MRKYLKLISYLLIIIGALNWGFVGFFGVDIIAKFFGELTLLSRIIYALVGISALVSLIVMATSDDTCI